MNVSRWIHRIRRRRTIEITASGKWFLALTVAFGVTAVLSGNTILYLLESLLLGFLILSGVLSDRMLWNLKVKWRENPSYAGAPVEDSILITNQSRLPAIAIELGEWTDHGFELRGFVPYLRGQSEVIASPAGRPYPNRGKHQWTGRVLSTRFPFGFARKIRWVSPESERWVRPKLMAEQLDPHAARNFVRAGTLEHEEGQLRPFQSGDDFREIAWIYSANLRGPHFLRLRSDHAEKIQLQFQGEALRGQALEAHLSELATALEAAKRKRIPIELEGLEASLGAPSAILDTEIALDYLSRYPSRPEK